MLVGVNPRGRCVVVTPLPQIANLPQKTIKEWLQKLQADLSRSITPLLNEGNILSFENDLNDGPTKKTNPNSISTLLPLKTIIIDIPVTISYIIKNLTFKIWAKSTHL